jgi:hypothetical protein
MDPAIVNLETILTKLRDEEKVSTLEDQVAELLAA